MKFVSYIFLIFFATQLKGQVIADPATGQMDITNQSDESLNANLLPQHSIVSLKVPVYNLNQLSALPSGSCKLTIRLGTNIMIDPSFLLSTAPLSNYFAWTSSVVGGQVIITGDLTTALPGDFAEIATFSLKGFLPGTSIIESSFLVTNHNTAVPLQDEDPNNNNASLSYTITLPIVPVTFTKFYATIKDCTITVNFSTENEINVDRYEIEMSKDGIDYDKAGQLTANGAINYIFNSPVRENHSGAQIFLRIKAVDKDGKFQYSEIRKLRRSPCDEKEWKLNLFPNPAGSFTDQVCVQSINGFFKGKYIISLADLSGKLIKTEVVELRNGAWFYYKTGSLPAGLYLLNIKNNDGSASSLLKLQKL